MGMNNKPIHKLLKFRHTPFSVTMRPSNVRFHEVTEIAFLPKMKHVRLKYFHKYKCTNNVIFNIN